MSASAPKLILVKHSLPHINPAAPARTWLLSEAGRRRCEPLADRLALYTPASVITSDEPKAAETGQRVARRLNLPCRSAPGLHEHDRSAEPFRSPEAFTASVAAFFARPDELVFGAETADQAHHRFARAVEQVIAHHAGQTIAVVSHGTVITLFVSRATGLPPFLLWERLGLPSFVALTLPALHVSDVVEAV
ncbi:MAG: histidine phosphatase family protein [Anaerolineae bacterium]